MNWKETVDMLSSRTRQLLTEQHRHLRGTSGEREGEATGEPLAFLLQEDYLRALWHDFSRYEKAVLYFFVFAVRDGVLSHRHAEQGIPGMPLVDFRLGLTLLRRKGIIYMVRRSWGETGYTMPREMAGIWRRLLLTCLSPVQVEEAEADLPEATDLGCSSPFTHPYPRLLRELLRVCADIRERPLPLTAGGTVQRRRLKQIMSLLSLTAETFRELDIPYEYNHSYSPVEAILLDLMLRLRLLSRENAQWCIDEQAVAAWLSQPPDRSTRQLFALFRTIVLPPEPLWQTAVDIMLLPPGRGRGNTRGANAREAKAREETNPGKSAKRTFSATIKYIRHHPGLRFFSGSGEFRQLTDANKFYSRLLRPLQEAGFLHAEWAGEDIQWQWLPSLVADTDTEGTETRGAEVQALEMQATEMPTAEMHSAEVPGIETGAEQQQLPAGKFYVQADFTVTVSPETPPAAEWLLSAFAEMSTVDGTTVYHLNKRSVERALSAGMKMEEIILFLQRHSITPLTPQLTDTLWRWAGEYGRISWEDVRLLRCADQRIANELASSPAVAEWLGERIGDREFIVPYQHWGNLVAAMETRGYPSPSPRRKNSATEEQEAETAKSANPANPAKSAIAAKTAAEEGSAVVRLVLRGAETCGYKVENVFPGLEDVFPGLHGIPRMWWKNFQGYHESTLRDLIQRAIAMEAPVRVQLRPRLTGQSAGAKELCFVPQKLRNENGFWVVQGTEGKRAVRLKTEEIARIQISLPELK